MIANFSWPCPSWLWRGHREPGRPSFCKNQSKSPVELPGVWKLPEQEKGSFPPLLVNFIHSGWQQSPCSCPCRGKKREGWRHKVLAGSEEVGTPLRKKRQEGQGLGPAKEKRTPKRQARMKHEPETRRQQKASPWPQGPGLLHTPGLQQRPPTGPFATGPLAPTILRGLQKNLEGKKKIKKERKKRNKS